ncbi:HIPL1 protein-like isoform X2 [Helianthus annuus]|uniref:HIPL1 protein-like isoform X2 n=1 Tax=Helianthus annuus TaxID=4232 RepID=UPI0016533BEC|nr:HIPL1 protein-like isoform X2 [Helianthus annuus]
MLFDDYYVLARTTDEAKDVLAQPLPHKRSVSLRDSAASSFHDMMKMNILLLSGTLFLLLINPALSLPLCTDLIAPVTHKTPPTFCNYNGSSCCDSTDNSNIRKQFESMNVSQPACASVLKSILCLRCDPFSAELFTIKTVARQVPVLCNSTVSSTNNYCETVWDTCQNVSITNSPFSPSLQVSALLKIVRDFE